MHEKWRVKPPAYDLLAQHFLARGLAKHPDVGKHIASVDDLERMPMMRLMTLAKVMGVDTDALIVGTEEDERARQRYCDENPGFSGVIEFDLTVEMFGKRVTRKARAKYDYTPPWPYYERRKRAVYEGWHGSSMSVEFRTVPDEDGDLGGPVWEPIDILQIGQLWNVLEDAIDEKSKAEDAERRRIAALKATSPDRPTRRRH